MIRPRVSVIVVNYNAGALLKACLASLAAQTVADHEVILVDNASSDASMRSAAPLDRRVRPLIMTENRGFAGGMNAGLAAAKAPWIASLNPDAQAEPQWLERLLEAGERRGAAMVASLQLDARDLSRLDGAGDVYHISGVAYRGGFGCPAKDAPKGGEVFGPCAAAALYDAEAVWAAGGFDERFFCYHEDVDLAYRLRLGGARAYFEPRAVVRHVGSAISGRRSEFTVFHGVRNRSWTFVKNTPLPLLIASAPLHLAALVCLMAIAWRQGVLRPTLRGYGAALAGLGDMWRSRKAVQSLRTVSLKELVSAMAFSPMALWRRAPMVRPWRNADGRAVPPGRRPAV